MDVTVLRSDDNVGWFKRQMDSGVTCFASMLPAEQTEALHIFHRTEHALMSSFQCSPSNDLFVSHERCCNLTPGNYTHMRLSSIEKENHLLKENLWKLWHPETNDAKKKGDVLDIVKGVVEQMTTKIEFFELVHLTQEGLDKYTKITYGTAVKETLKKVGRPPKRKRKEVQNPTKPKKRKNPHPKKVTKNVVDNQEYDTSPPIRKSRRRAAIKSTLKLEIALKEDKKHKQKTKNLETSHSGKKEKVKKSQLEQIDEFTCSDGKLNNCEDEESNSENIIDNELPQSYTCEQCDKAFEEQSLLLDHLSTEHFLPDVPESNSEVKEMIEMKTVAQPYSCVQCRTSFSKLANLNRHMKNKHSSSTPVICEDCPSETFKSEIALWLHYNSKHSEKEGKSACLNCGERCGDEELKLHIKTHLPTANFACKQCAMMFAEEIDFDAHLEDHKQDIFQCIPCKAKFGSAYILSKHCHSSTHQLKTGQRPMEKKHLCAQCGRSYFRKHALLRHMRYHTGEKPYKCPHCEYTCREDTNLKLHVALHFSRRDYVCDVCGSAFHQRKTLERHVLYKHQDARNFVCATCSMAFKTRYALSRHEQVHSAARPFTCRTCGAAFKRMYNLRHHVKTVHSAGSAGAADNVEEFPPPRHVKVIDVPEGEAVKGNRRGRNPKPNPKMQPPMESFEELDNKIPQIQQFQAPDVWQKDADTAGTLQLLLGNPMDQQDGAFTTPLLPQPTSTLNHDLLSRIVLPTSGTHIIEAQEQQQQHIQQQQQAQHHQFLPISDATPQHAEPVLIDKQFQETTYPYYLLPSVNPQQT